MSSSKAASTAALSPAAVNREKAPQNLGNDSVMVPTPTELNPVIYHVITGKTWPPLIEGVTLFGLGVLASEWILPKLFPRRSFFALRRATALMLALPVAAFGGMLWNASKYMVVQRSVEKMGFILIPGALVDPVAYSVIASRLSDRGLVVAVVNTEPFRAPTEITGASHGDVMKIMHDVLSLDDGVATTKEWAIGGHSMGALAAYSLLTDMRPRITKLVLWGRSDLKLPLGSL
eukprot:g3540.t1